MNSYPYYPIRYLGGKFPPFFPELISKMLRSQFSQQRVSNSKHSDPDILYYNASIVNRGVEDLGAGRDPPIVFSETRANALISDISQYYFSIVRFSMSAGKNLPLFIPLVRTGQADINRTIYEAQIDIAFDYNIPAVGVRSFTHTANTNNWVN